MVTVPIHKDVLNYEPKVFALLTARTLKFTLVALALGIGVGALCLGVLRMGTDVAVYPIMIATLPVFLLGWARPCKMRPEELLPYLLRAYFLPQRLVYEPTPVIEKDPAALRHAGKERQDNGKPEDRLQRHYARLRGERGIEADWAGAPLDPRR